MSQILSIAIIILVAAFIALAVVVSFSKKSVSAKATVQHMTPDSSNFFLSFQDVHIDHAEMREIFKAMKKHIVGMDYFLNGLLVGLLAGGHVLVEGAPGLAKTKSIRLLSSLLDLDTKRIQFTPDMLPADLIGVDMFNPSSHSFETFFGPLFTNILLADEINRATPKVQSALLEAMQERQVTIGGVSYPIKSPFFVLATQNPIEQDGTYPLPEAQLDRFMMKLTVDYPSMEVEKQIINTATADTEKLDAIMTAETLLELQAKVQNIHASEQMVDYVAGLVTATREPHKDLAYGSSPRGSLAIMSIAKAVAFLEGRKSIDKKDVQRAVLPALRHRIILSVQAQMNDRVDSEVLFDRVKSFL